MNAFVLVSSSEIDEVDMFHENSQTFRNEIIFDLS